METGKIKIIKTDSENQLPIEGVTFQLKNADGKVVANATTNKEGIATFTSLLPGNYVLKEISTNAKYIISKQEFNVNVEFNKTTTKSITNDPKKGDLKIYKVDKDNHRIALGNVKFELYLEEEKRIIGTYITDTNGEITIEGLRIGNYRLIEKNTGKWYNLAEDTDIIVKWNEENPIVVENELKKGQIKVVKVDKDNHNIKLEGVEFEVLDLNDKVLEKIVTDENGEALTSKYPIRDYESLRLKETKTLETYQLNSKIENVTLKENVTETVIIENETEKGQIRVIKVDKDNNEIKLEGVTFNIIDEKGTVVDTIITDKNGEAISKELPIALKHYTIIEKETKNEYVLTKETQTVELKANEIIDVIFENELKKSQVKVIKVDEENHEIKLKDVEFEVLDRENNVLETIRTNEQGEAVTSRYPVKYYPELYIRETLTNERYVLDDTVHKIVLKENEIVNEIFENKKIKGQIKVVKTSEKDSKITGAKAGEPMPNVSFDIYDENKKYVETIKTAKDGTAITSLLNKGNYFVKESEKDSPEWYLLNTNEYSAEIVNDGDVIILDITNIPENPDVDIEKDGIIQTTANQEIKYNFHIKNTGNTSLDHFVWTDILPTDYITATRLITGTYNQDLNYAIYYKTNKNGYKLLKDNLNTQVNNYISFTDIQLEKGEYVTEFKADFRTVDVGFESLETPQLFVNVKSTVKNDDVFTNKTRIEGYNKTYLVWDEDDHTTKVYEKKIEVKLPRTGC